MPVTPVLEESGRLGGPAIGATDSGRMGRQDYSVMLRGNSFHIAIHCTMHLRRHTKIKRQHDAVRHGKRQHAEIVSSRGEVDSQNAALHGRSCFQGRGSLLYIPRQGNPTTSPWIEGAHGHPHLCLATTSPTWASIHLVTALSTQNTARNEEKKKPIFNKSFPDKPLLTLKL